MWLIGVPMQQFMADYIQQCDVSAHMKATHCTRPDSITALQIKGCNRQPALQTKLVSKLAVMTHSPPASQTLLGIVRKSSNIYTKKKDTSRRILKSWVSVKRGTLVLFTWLYPQKLIIIRFSGGSSAAHSLPNEAAQRGSQSALQHWRWWRENRSRMIDGLIAYPVYYCHIERDTQVYRNPNLCRGQINSAFINTFTLEPLLWEWFITYLKTERWFYCTAGRNVSKFVEHHIQVF